MYAQNLSAFGVPGPQGFKAIDVRDISLNRIDVGPRQRPLDRKKVEELAKSIMEHGQKQPIAVRNKPGGGCELIFGYHRLEAMKLIDREGLDKRQSIWATIYPEDYPDIRIQMDELVENLHRNDLTPAEKAAHQTMYAALLKKLNKVSLADKKRSESEKKTKSGNGVCERQPVAHIPTITEKLAADLGVDERTIQRRHKNAQKLATRVGVVMPSLEKATPEQLEEGGQAAKLVAQDKKEKAATTGKPEAFVDAVNPQKSTKIHLDLDVIDLPDQLCEWGRKRFHEKKLTLTVMKQTYLKWGELINDLESHE